MAQPIEAPQVDSERVERFVCLCPGSLSPYSPAHMLVVRTKTRTYAHCTLRGCGAMVVLSHHQMPSLRLPAHGGLLVEQEHAEALLYAVEALRQQRYLQPAPAASPHDTAIAWLRGAALRLEVSRP